MEELKKEFEEKFLSKLKVSSNLAMSGYTPSDKVWAWIEQKLKQEYKRGFEQASEKATEHIPYSGWCDVEGCRIEGCSGGTAWREGGYWTVCSEHSNDHRIGKSQPKMKLSAIERENSRDKETGYLDAKKLKENETK